MPIKFSELEQDVNEFWALVLQIVADGEKRLAAHMAAHNLTTPQFYVLKTLVEHDGRCRIGEIAREHHLTNATMTGLIKRLEAMHPPLVLREQNTADRRSVHVVLTPTGEERFMAVQVDLLEQARAIFNLLTAEERQDLLHYLSHYVKVVAELFPVGKLSLDGYGLLLRNPIVLSANSSIDENALVPPAHRRNLDINTNMAYNEIYVAVQ